MGLQNGSMWCHDESPYEQICEVLGMSLPAVKSLLFRARNDLKEKLAGYLDVE